MSTADSKPTWRVGWDMFEHTPFAFHHLSLPGPELFPFPGDLFVGEEKDEVGRYVPLGKLALDLVHSVQQVDCDVLDPRRVDAAWGPAGERVDLFPSLRRPEEDPEQLLA